MAESEIQVEINSIFDKEGEKITKVIIPSGLKDSRVVEKFLTSYVENISRIQIEKEKTEQLKEQNKRKKEEDQYKSLYLLAVVTVVAMLIIAINKDHLVQVVSAVVLFVICVILCNKRNYACQQNAK